MSIMRIKEIRMMRGFSQNYIASQMGVGSPTVSNWESEVALPKTRELPRLAKVLGCTIDDLYVHEAEEPEFPPPDPEIYNDPEGV